MIMFLTTLLLICSAFFQPCCLVLFITAYCACCFSVEQNKQQTNNQTDAALTVTRTLIIAEPLWYLRSMYAAVVEREVSHEKVGRTRKPHRQLHINVICTQLTQHTHRLLAKHGQSLNLASEHFCLILAFNHHHYSINLWCICLFCR